MRVIVVGGNGYVGHQVVERALKAGLHVTVIGRDPTTARIVLGDLFPKVNFATLGEFMTAPGPLGETAAVINLSQIKDAPFHRLMAENERLMRSVHEVAMRLQSPRLIHISSVSVCGFPLAAEPLPQRVEMRLGDPYIETKIHAERVMERAARSGRYELSIVRLGNVIGSGSPGWTAGIAQRISEGSPVAFEGEIGHSNATHVLNVADYLVRLATTSVADLRSFGRYHHVAEFAGHSWRPILDTLSRAVDKEWVAVSRNAQESTRPSSGGWVGMATRVQSSVLGGYVRFALIRVGSWSMADRLISWVGQKKKSAAFGFAPAFTISQQSALLPETVATRVVFRSHTLPGWDPPLSFPEALEEIGRWVSEAGYRYHW